MQVKSKKILLLPNTPQHMEEPYITITPQHMQELDSDWPPENLYLHQGLRGALEPLA